MQLGRYHVSTLQPTIVHSIDFSEDGELFAIAFEGGYEVWRACPLGLVRRRSLSGTLARAIIVPKSPLLVLQGGGTSPLYPPNKAVIFHDGVGRAIAELEFSERIRGIALREGTICIVLSRRTMGFEYGINVSSAKGKEVQSQKRGFWIRKFGEWETASNEHGLIALSTSNGSSLLVLPGRQSGHVQLIHLSHASSSRTAPFRSPIILAHTHPLSTLACSRDGTEIITTSERGTLIRVWDITRGSLSKELRRGVDRAEMWGVGFEPRPAEGLGRVVGWSDKGTVHVWATAPSEIKSNPSLAHILSRNLPLPKYFSSSASIAQFHLPRKNPHAFSSVMGAAADAAGVPSAKLSSTMTGEDEELSERFMVGWIRTPLDMAEQGSTPVIKAASTLRDQPPPGRGLSETRSCTPLSMGGRDERASLGSDGTSRTATPTFSRRASEFVKHARGASETRFMEIRESDIPSKGATVHDAGLGGFEMQLVAITYSGDYYRLRIPQPGSDEDQVEGGGDSKKKCELVEYRRLKVGGGGW
ncbi:hypothetical protein BD324DRAFT_622668 [Kockovaella imperatae]|uniref:WD40-repeat-containing domain protein n=1 Tax=Kockovaella imperatae TaxID=4999 RepID=A0A1Y1UKH0_9TREE|nr:hypothetical protein BD324DRAFT_622668 [Kockovaella imperatae]ORX37625.1 hypothetical protein BD324DRAFT_622668 [Kockovaella imperatae]